MLAQDVTMVRVTIKKIRNYLKSEETIMERYEMGPCPNLRSQKKGGFFSGCIYTCSATGRNIDSQYVAKICRGVNVKDRNGNWHGAHADCNAFRGYGVCNSRR